MTQLRQMVLDELQRRNYAEITIKNYLRIIDDFAQYSGQPIEKLGPNHIRVYQAHLSVTANSLPRQFVSM